LVYPSDSDKPCQVCHEAPRIQRLGIHFMVCQECFDSQAYYDSLTPDERREEEESIARYVDETSGGV